MRTLFIVLLSVLCLGKLSAFDIPLITDRLYIGGFVGENNLKRCHRGPIDAKFKPGLLAGAVVGYEFSTLRLEAEVSLRRHRLDYLKYFNTREHHKMISTTLAYMLNICYDLKLHPRFIPYIGFGIGMVHSDFKAHIQGVKVSDRSDGVASQYIFGVESEVCSNLGLALEYRYLDARAHANDHGITLCSKFYF